LRKSKKQPSVKEKDSASSRPGKATIARLEAASAAAEPGLILSKGKRKAYASAGQSSLEKGENREKWGMPARDAPYVEK